jgi:hypothetical protein
VAPTIRRTLAEIAPAHLPESASPPARVEVTDGWSPGDACGGVILLMTNLHTSTGTDLALSQMSQWIDIGGAVLVGAW